MPTFRTWSLACTAALTACLAALSQPPAAAQSVNRAKVKITAGPNVHVSKAFSSLPHYENLAIGDPGHAGRLTTCSMVYPPEGDKLAFQYCYVTWDGGRTWEPTLKVEEGRVNGDPTMVYAKGDELYVVALVLKDSDKPRDPADSEANALQPKTVVFKSTDAGKTFSEASRFQFIDREFISWDHTSGKYAGRFYIAGQGSVRGIGGPQDRRSPSLQLFRSLDGGKTFTGPVHAAYPERTTIFGVATAVVLSDGTYVVMFGHTKPGRGQGLETEPSVGPNGELHVITSTDGGETFAKSVKITDWRADRPRSEGGQLGQLVADPGSPAFKDRLYAVWPAIVSDRIQLQCAYSTDKGKTWSKPVVVNDDRSPVQGGAGPDHLLPSIGVNKDGVVLVTWYDRREAKDNLGWRLRASASLDGGETFSASVPVADAANAFTDGTKWTLGGGGSSDEKTSVVSVGVSFNSFFNSGGHTTGLAVDADGTFHPTWIDNRSGLAQLWTSSITVQGAVVKNGAPDLSDLEDVSKHVSMEIARPTLDRTTGALTFEATLKNLSKHAVEGPVKVRVLTLESPLAVPQIVGADNGETGTGAVWDFSQTITGALESMARSQSKKLTFKLSDVRSLRPGKDWQYQLVTMDTRVYAKLRKAKEEEKK